MIISARSIPKYLHGMRFPVDVLSEKSKHVAFVLMNREELLALCDVEAVTASGTYNKIKFLRVNRPMQEIESLRMKLVAVIPVAEDSRTVQRDHNTYLPHMRRSRAYSPESKQREK
jgi:hypothetical protein